MVMLFSAAAKSNEIRVQILVCSRKRGAFSSGAMIPRLFSPLNPFIWRIPDADERRKIKGLFRNKHKKEGRLKSLSANCEGKGCASQC